MFVQRGRLTYLGLPFWSVRLETIDELMVGEFRSFLLRHNGVKLRLKNGREKWLPTSLLRPSPQEIADLLRSLN